MPTPIYLLFDERMALHRPVGASDIDLTRLFEEDKERMMKEGQSFVAERPARIYALYHALQELERRSHQPSFIPLTCHPVQKETVCLVHSEEHYQRMLATSQLSDRKLKELEVEDDLYFCRDTFLAASLACGGVVDCVNAVTDSMRTETGSNRAIALVRPPGHHALRDSPMGKFALVLLSSKTCLEMECDPLDCKHMLTLFTACL